MGMFFWVCLVVESSFCLGPMNSGSTETKRNSQFNHLLFPSQHRYRRRFEQSALPTAEISLKEYQPTNTPSLGLSVERDAS